MIKKIILLDDKSDRQENFYKVDFSKLNNIESISGEKECNTLLDNFMLDKHSFSSYDFIIIHKNIDFKEKKENLFKKLKEEYESKLIYFTGDSSPKKNKNITTISSRNMYKNLQIFNDNVGKGQENVLMLQYGQNWEVDILLNVLEQINLFIENGKNYRENIKLSELKKIGINNDFDIDKPENIRDIILENIEKKLND